jgi:hypothetical protein
VPGPEVVERGTDKEVLMSTHALDHALGRATATSTASRHAAWLLAGLALGFAVPAVLAELLELPRDLYYGILRCDRRPAAGGVPGAGGVRGVRRDAAAQA